jgi:hypothetical protein
MIKQNAIVAELTGVVPTNGKSFKIKSPDRKRALGESRGGSEPRVADPTAIPARVNGQLRREIKERRPAEKRLLKEQRYLRDLRVAPCRHRPKS